MGIKVPDNELFNSNTAYKADEIVALLIGWLRSSTANRYVNLTLQGISLDQLPKMVRLEGTLADQLEEGRRAALRAWRRKKVDGDSVEAIEEAQNEVEKINDLFRLAREYLIDVNEEIGNDSTVLKIDQERTTATGVNHYTIGSIDKWAREKYGFSVCDRSSESPIKPPENTSAAPESPRRNHDVVNTRTLATFGLLIRAFVKRTQDVTLAPKFRSIDNPNIDAIAKELADLGEELNSGQALQFQAKDTISHRIEQAIEALENALPTKRGASK